MASLLSISYAPWALLPIGVYCLLQIVRDLRAKHYLFAAAGIACLALLLLVPIQSNAVKLDLPAPH